MRQNGVAAGSYNYMIATKLFRIFSYAPPVKIFMWKKVLNFFKLWVSSLIAVDNRLKPVDYDVHGMAININRQFLFAEKNVSLYSPS